MSEHPAPSAEDVGCAPLSIDTNKLEDMKLLQEIRAIEKVALSRPATDFAGGKGGYFNKKYLNKKGSGMR